MGIYSIYYFENSFPIQYILEILPGEYIIALLSMRFIKWLYHNLFCGITLMNILIAKYFGNMGKWKTLNSYRPLCIYTCANKFQYRSLEFK